jgi:acetyl-CoA acetyltransferase
MTPSTRPLEAQDPVPVRLADRVAVVGVGETPFTRDAGVPTVRLALDAVMAALDDAGLVPTDVDAVFPPYGAHQSATTEDLVANLGLEQVRHRSVFYLGGASAVASLEAAVMAIVTGVARTAVVFRARRGSSGRRATVRALEVLPNQAYRRDLELPYGFTSPVHWPWPTRLRGTSTPR